jgi:hypothetical protein
VPIDTRAPVERATRWAPVAVVALAVLLPLVLTSMGGADGLPRNDDWSYRDLLWRWHDHGDLRLGGWESMTLVGQLLLAWPVVAAFPRNVVALQVFTLVVGALGALAAYGALRRFVSVPRAFLATALTIISPLYTPLAMSFMTDVPAFATQAVCSWLGASAVTPQVRRPRRWFAAAVAVGLFGVTIREYAVVAPAAVLVVFGARAWGRRDREALVATAVATVIGAIFVAGFVAWRRSWANSLSLEPGVPDGFGDFGRAAVFTVVTLAFLVLPALAFAPLRRLVRSMVTTRWSVVLVVSAAIVLVAGAVATWEWSPPLLGPYLDQRGALGNDILPGDRALIVPAPVLRAVLLVVLAATILLVGVIVLTATDMVRRGQTWRDRCAAFDARTLAWAIVVLTTVSLIAAGTADLPIFDRYVLPAVPFAAGLVLAWHPTEVDLAERSPHAVLRWVTVVAFAAGGLLWSVDSARFDATRWAAGEQAVRLGYPADRVDAGFEWRNVHRPAGEFPSSPTQPDRDACVRLTASGVDLGPDWTPVFSIDHWHGWGGTDELTAWATTAPGCPPLP